MDECGFSERSQQGDGETRFSDTCVTKKTTLGGFVGSSSSSRAKVRAG
jgi:hypothetical protein